jgi:hypothetical protein
MGCAGDANGADFERLLSDALVNEAIGQSIEHLFAWWTMASRTPLPSWGSFWRGRKAFVSEMPFGGSLCDPDAGGGSSPRESLSLTEESE